MTAEGARRRKFAEAMSYHVFRDVNGNKLFAVMDGERVPHEIRRDHGCAAPSLDDFLLTATIERINLSLKLVVDKGSFLK